MPEAGSLYLYGTFEQRSEHSEEWRKRATDVDFVEVHEEGAALIRIGMVQDTPSIPLRDMDQLKLSLRSFGRRIVYIDITGLSHHVWAPLLRSSWEQGFDVRAVYVEPRDYRYSTLPTQGQIFDLSERIDGIAPIPGFASLVENREDTFCLVPLLGFEGTRFSYLIEQVEPPGNRIYPVVGVPGFRAEYPFHTYHGNQAPLTEARAWKNVRFARANSPARRNQSAQRAATQTRNGRQEIGVSVELDPHHDGVTSTPPARSAIRALPRASSAPR